MDGIEELTVDQLKTELKQRGLPVSGRKSDLIDRLNDSNSTLDHVIEESTETVIQLISYSQITACLATYLRIL